MLADVNKTIVAAVLKTGKTAAHDFRSAPSAPKSSLSLYLTVCRAVLPFQVLRQSIAMFLYDRAGFPCYSRFGPVFSIVKKTARQVLLAHQPPFDRTFVELCRYWTHQCHVDSVQSVMRLAFKSLYTAPACVHVN